jgi:ankyrin repeat protein
MLLPIVPSSLLSTSNRAGSTALHWAVLNAQLSAARRLVEFPGGPGIDLIDIKNAAGRSPLAEAEAAGWDEGAKWLVEVMRLVDAGGAGAVAEEEEATADSQVEDQNQEDPDGGASHISAEGPGVGGCSPSSS